jgi:hypothetical protein
VVGTNPYCGIEITNPAELKNLIKSHTVTVYVCRTYKPLIGDEKTEFFSKTFSIDRNSPTQ